MTRKEFIQLLRKNGFNCFPIPIENGKNADNRYKAAQTPLNQEIRENENYGYIAMEGNGNCTVDLDDKERFRFFAEKLIKEGFMVIETGNGWHIPVIGLTDDSTKMELFDYDIKDTKIMEIQGTKHYVMGICCKIFHEKLLKEVEYKNVGGNTIFHVKSDFITFVEDICKNLKVAGKKKSSSAHSKMRQAFLKGKIPSKGTSNDYFYNAALQCNTDGLSREQATDKIKIIYDKWEISNTFSNRLWSNIEKKINNVYDNNDKIQHGGSRTESKTIDLTEIAQDIIEDREIYSDIDTEIIYENNNGFLESIKGTLRKELQRQYPSLRYTDHKEIQSKIIGLADDVPSRNKDLKVFRNGTYSEKEKGLIEPKENELAHMGFKNLDYVENPNPKKFLDIMFNNVPKSEHSRIKSGLRSALRPYLDPRISIIHGLSRVGKSTGLSILVKLLEDNAMIVELDDLLGDHFIRAKIKGKTLLVLQELPTSWKDFATIKALTGEQTRTERGFHSDSTQFDNTIKIWASGNYLSKIPEKEENAMYTSRLSLIHNTKQKPFPENPNLESEIMEKEGSEIISWILNLTEEECIYEKGSTVKQEWEKLANPENKWVSDKFEFSNSCEIISLYELIRQFEKDTGQTTNATSLKNVLTQKGFSVYDGTVKNLCFKTGLS
jgi:hypothetical protein